MESGAAHERIEAALDRLNAAVASVHNDLRSHMAAAAAAAATANAGAAAAASGAAATPPNGGAASPPSRTDSKDHVSLDSKERIGFFPISPISPMSRWEGLSSSSLQLGGFDDPQNEPPSGSHDSFFSSAAASTMDELGGSPTSKRRSIDSVPEMRRAMLSTSSMFGSIHSMFGSSDGGGEAAVPMEEEPAEVVMARERRQRRLTVADHGRRAPPRERRRSAGPMNMAKSVSLGLPTGWPGNLQAHNFGDEFQWQDVDMLPTVTVADPQQQIALDPEKFGLLQAAFSLLGFFVLCHDLIVTPFFLAWEVPFVGYVAISTNVSVAFWILDILMSLIVGFKSFTRDSKRNLRRYLRTWFAFDVALVIGDVTALTFLKLYARDQPAEAVRLIRLVKVAKLLRIASFLRVLQVWQRIREVARNSPEYWKGSMSASTVFAALIWYTHIGACCWYAVGRYGYSDTGQRWLLGAAVVNGEVVRFLDTPTTYQYLSAFHWALQQVVLAGTTDTPCTNGSERIFNIFCLSLAFVFGSFLVSTLSAALVELRSRRQDRDQKVKNLRRYLRQHCVPYSLSCRVIQQVADRLTAQAAEGEENLPALELLSSRLRVELHAQICAPSLASHPLFRLWVSMDTAWYSRMCMEAIKIGYLRDGDYLFSNGAQALAAHVLVSGLVAYSQSETQERDAMVTLVKDPGSWFAESALWSEWLHVGTATAQATCKILTIKAASFLEVCKGHRVIGGLAAAYCKQFHRRIVTASPRAYSWPNDLHVPGTDFADLVSSMPKEVRTLIGAHAIEKYNFATYEVVTLMSRTRGGRRSLAAEKLRSELLREVMAGTSTVVLDGTGKLARVVALCIVRVEDHYGRLLMQLGKQEPDYTIKVGVELPGAKCLEDEPVEGTLRRILAGKLAPFADLVVLSHVEVTSSEGSSGEFGVHTKYLHTVCHGSMMGSLTHLPQCVPGHPPSDQGLLSRVNISLSNRSSNGPDDVDTSALPHAITAGPVYFIRYQSKGAYYAWLSQADMDMLQRKASKAALRDYLTRLEVPGDEGRRSINSAVGAFPSFHSREDSATAVEETLVI